MLILVILSCTLLISNRISSAQENSQQCTETPLESKDKLSSFDIVKHQPTIAIGVQCSWIITAPNQKRVLIQLDINPATTEQQCVTVSNTPGGEDTKLCQKVNENLFVSTSESVTVTYTAHQVVAGVSNFKVFYKTTQTRSPDCTETPVQAKDKFDAFDVVKYQPTITKGVQCSWTITAPPQKRVLVYLDINPATIEQQCITVSNTPDGKRTKLCQKRNENQFISDGYEVTVTYTAHQLDTEVSNFKVFYKTAPDNRAQCTDTPLTAKDFRQFFDIVKEKNTINKDLDCLWTITAPDRKRILVYLDINPYTTNLQCVTVSNTPGGEGTKLCQRTNENIFLSDGHEVTVAYVAHHLDSGVPNFKVAYKIAGAPRVAPGFIILLFVLFLLPHVFNLPLQQQ